MHRFRLTRGVRIGAGIGAVVLVAGTAVLAFSLSATRGSVSNSSTVADAEAPARLRTADGSADKAAPGGALAPAQLTQTGRSITHVGTVTVRVENVTAAASTVTSAAAAAGGYVGNDRRTASAGTSDDPRPESGQARLVLRVPADRFVETMDGASRLGRELDRSVTSEDVTEQVADVEARVTTAKASIARIRELMAKTQSIGEVVSLESELTRRQADLESLEARQHRLADLTSLATVTVILQGPSGTKQHTDSGFMAALTGSGRALASSGRALLVVIGALVPWLAVAALVAAPVLVVRRRRAASKTRIAD